MGRGPLGSRERGGGRLLPRPLIQSGSSERHGLGTGVADSPDRLHAHHLEKRLWLKSSPLLKPGRQQAATLSLWPTTSASEQDLNEVKGPGVLRGVRGVALLICTGPGWWLDIFSFCVIVYGHHQPGRLACA